MFTGQDTGKMTFSHAFNVDENALTVISSLGTGRDGINDPKGRVPGVDFHRHELNLVDHVYVGFGSGSSLETIQYETNKFWHYMKDGKTVYGAARAAYNSTATWAKADSARSKPASFILKGDCWTRLNPNNNVITPPSLL
jgi:hypothetical protein